VKIDNKLNLIIPVYDEDMKTIVAYVHSTPIDAGVWDKYWEPMSIAFTRIMAGGHGAVGGPRIADKMLRKVAQELGVWEGIGGVENGLIEEIKRRTLVLAPRESGGWEQLPFHEACKTILCQEDGEEIQGALVFFTLVSWGNRRGARKQMLEIAMELWGARVESLSYTEFRDSLPTLIVTANTGVTAAA
jgi:hypothetical protein